MKARALVTALFIAAFFSFFPIFSFAEQDLTPSIGLNKSRMAYDRLNKISYFQVSVKNISDQVILTPIKVYIDSTIPSDVLVRNMDGISEDGLPFFIYTSATGRLLPGEEISASVWEFYNPNASRFSYTTSSFGELPDDAEVIGASGGFIETPEGITLEIPVGSLIQDTTITAKEIPNEVLENYTTMDNSRLGEAVSFSPDGLTFEEPVTITLPLESEETPGRVLPIYIHNGDTDRFEDSGFTCEVSDDGLSCLGEISHFTDYCIAYPSQVPILWRLERRYFVQSSLLLDKLKILGPRLPNSRMENFEKYPRWGMNEKLNAYITLKEVSPVEEDASKLYGSLLEGSDLLQTVEPVLFVHGFQKYNRFGGGEKYWGKFFELINQLEIEDRTFTSFDFQWRTNARFQDVADDLYHAIQTIYSRTGNQKVHIVAHSFGGILTRVLLQGLSAGGHDASSMVASVTTLGTPHSGIAREKKEMHGVTLPKGQDAFWHKGANQISAHQMGESIEPGDWCNMLEFSCDEGGIASKIAEIENHSLPNLPIQVGIGLTSTPIWEDGSYDGDPDYYRLDDGDRLISYKGQRIFPDLALNGDCRQLLNGQYGTNDTLIKETLLGVNGDFCPGDKLFYSDFDGSGRLNLVDNRSLPLFGYTHSTGTEEAGYYLFLMQNYISAEVSQIGEHASYRAVREWLSSYSSRSTDQSEPVRGVNKRVALLVQNASSLDDDEAHMMEFLENNFYDYEIVDPEILRAQIVDLSSFDIFYMRTSSQPIAYNDIEIVNMLSENIKDGASLIMEYYGVYLGYYLGIGEINLISWDPVVHDAVYYVESDSTSYYLDNIETWSPPSSPDRETQLIAKLNQTGVYTYPVVTFLENEKYVSFLILVTTYGWPWQSIAHQYCLGNPNICTGERSIYTSDYLQKTGIRFIDYGEGKIFQLGLNMGQSVSANAITFGPVAIKIRKNIISNSNILSKEALENARNNIGKTSGNCVWNGITSFGRWSDGVTTFCARFVRMCFGLAASHSDAISVYDHYNDLGLIKNDSKPPPGSVVFYAAHSENGGYGHVGIASDNEKLISVTSKSTGVHETSIVGYFAAQYLGYITATDYVNYQ